jgi:uncharacterized protein (TIGR03086 family)
MDLLDLFERGTEWTASKIPGAADQLDSKTPCEDWQVRDLLNHMIDSQQFFAATARGEQASLPGSPPPERIGDDPAGAYEEMRQETLSAYRRPGVLEKTGPSLGIAFCDQLIHGADLARATGQDDTMPDGLAEAAFQMIDGNLTPDNRGAGFKPEVDAPANASAQERLLAYTGRRP